MKKKKKKGFLRGTSLEKETALLFLSFNNKNARWSSKTPFDFPCCFPLSSGTYTYIYIQRVNPIHFFFFRSGFPHVGRGIFEKILFSCPPCMMLPPPPLSSLAACESYYSRHHDPPPQDYRKEASWSVRMTATQSLERVSDVGEKCQRRFRFFARFFYIKSEVMWCFGKGFERMVRVKKNMR